MYFSQKYIKWRVAHHVEQVVGPLLISYRTLCTLERLTDRGSIDKFVLISSNADACGRYRVRLHIGAGCYELPGQQFGVERIHLGSGDVLVLRQLDTDPYGPWALSVELAEHALHRQTLAALHASFAAGEVALEQRRRAMPVGGKL